MKFDWPAEYRAAQLWPALRQICADLASEIGRKEVCDDLDISKSTLSNMLSERDRHSLKAEQLLYFVMQDNSGRLLREIASAAGYEIEPVRPMTPEEELAELKARVRAEFGPAGERVVSGVGR